LLDSCASLPYQAYQAVELATTLGKSFTPAGHHHAVLGVRIHRGADGHVIHISAPYQRADVIWRQTLILHICGARQNAATYRAVYVDVIKHLGKNSKNVKSLKNKKSCLKRDRKTFIICQCEIAYLSAHFFTPSAFYTVILPYRIVQLFQIAWQIMQISLEFHFELFVLTKSVTHGQCDAIDLRLPSQPQDIATP